MVVSAPLSQFRRQATIRLVLVLLDYGGFLFLMSIMKRPLVCVRVAATMMLHIFLQEDGITSFQITKHASTEIISIHSILLEAVQELEISIAQYILNRVGFMWTSGGFRLHNNRKYDFVAPLFGTIALFGCNNHDDCSKVIFTVPNDYCGTFAVIEDQDAPQARIDEDGTYALVVPANGKVKIKSTLFLSCINSLLGAYENGNRLAGRLLPPTTPFSDQTYLQQYTVDASGTYYFFVGSDREMATLYDTRDITLGGVLKSPKPE